MSLAGGGDPPRAKHLGLVTASIMAATIMQALDTTIANIALPHMQGTFSVGQDEIAWVLTSYIVASAIATPLTGWLATSYGTKRLLLVSIAGFTFSSFLCGIAGSIEQMVLFRLMQGVCGAALVPLAQSVLIDINPPAKQGGAMAIWGAGVMLGPILGPTIGGWLTDQYSWRYVFYINIPIGMLAFTGLVLFLTETPRNLRRFDFFGFAMLSLGVGALQMMLDRGELKDWFGSREIMIELGLAIAGFWVFIVHSATAKQPFLNLGIFRDRNFTVGQIMMFLISFLIYSSTALLPTLLQVMFNYPVVTAGWLMTPRGIGTMGAMLLIGKIANKIDVRVLMLIGFLIDAYAFWLPAHWTLDMGWEPFVWAGVLQGIGMGFLFVPLSLSSFATIDPKYRNEGTAIFSLVRNIGGSIGISIAEAYLDRSIQGNHDALASQLTPLTGALTAPGVQNFWNIHTPQGLGALDAVVNQQASMMAYLYNFWLMVAVALCAIPLLLLVRKIDPTRAQGRHAAAE